VNISESDIQSGINRTVLLDPEEETGPILAIRIMLNNGTYYLVEDRQQIGYDSSLPGSGILILFCNDSEPSGYGPARVVSAHPPSLGADAAFNLGLFANDFYGNLALNIGIKLISKWDNGTFKVLVGQYGPVSSAPIAYQDVTIPVVFGIGIIAVISVVSIIVYIKRGRRAIQKSNNEIPVIKLS
jgi:hypothetical protein